MAGVPKRATHLEDELIGAAWSEDSLRDAAKALSSDFEPLSDARASAEYRMTVLKNLVVRTYVDATGGVV
jgi:xanthine dehydrogenase small subunit